MTALFFIFGLFIGSFLNTVVLRLEKEKNIFGRSHCPHCGKKLFWFELVPLVSFLIQKGRCRICRRSISFFYPIGELTSGLIFYLTANYFFNTFAFTFALHSGDTLWAILFLVSFLFYASILFVVAIFDLRNYLIPETVLFIGLIGALFFNAIFFLGEKFTEFSFLGAYFRFLWPDNFILSKILGLLVIGGFFFLLWFFSKGRAMGFGDVEVGALIGFALGLYDGVFSLLITFLVGGIFALALMALKKKTRKSHLPYAPFLALGFLITIIFGQTLLELYFKLFTV